MYLTINSGKLVDTFAASFDDYPYSYNFTSLMTKSAIPMMSLSVTAILRPSRALAGNDVRMPEGSVKRLQQALTEGYITRSDLKVNAKRVLELLLKFD